MGDRYLTATSSFFGDCRTRVTETTLPRESFASVVQRPGTPDLNWLFDLFFDSAHQDRRSRFSLVT